MGTWVELFFVETSKTQEKEGRKRQRKGWKELVDSNFCSVKTPEIPGN